MVDKAKFVDFVKPSDHEVLKGLIKKNWEADLFNLPPLSSITPASSYLLTLGSAIYPSLATTNPQGIRYFAGFDYFRGDFNSKNINEPLVNIDRYIVSEVNSSAGTAGIFKIPFHGYHWPKLHDPIIQKLPFDWKFTIKDLLRQKRELK